MSDSENQQGGASEQSNDSQSHEKNTGDIGAAGGAFSPSEGQQQEAGAPDREGVSSGEEGQEKPQQTWQLDDNTAIEGERPAWLPEKYKTAEELAKAYKSLQDRMGQAPSEYEIKSENLDAEFEPLKDALKLAKSKSVPQEVVSSITEAVDKYIDSFKIDYQAEREKLGADHEDQINILNNWAKTTLSKESYSALFDSLKTAEAFKAIQEIRGIIMSNQSDVPAGNANSTSGQMSSADVQAEISANINKYRDDISYRRQLKEKLETALKREGAI